MMVDHDGKGDPSNRAALGAASSPGAQTVRLRAPKLEDASIYFHHLQDPNVTIWLEDACQRPMSYSQVERFVMAPVWYRRAIEHNGAFVGLTGLEDPDLMRGVARFFVVIGDRSVWGQGVGETVLRMVVEEGFEGLGLRKIVSNYFAPNVASEVIHARAGFSVEGCLRQDAWRNGAWVDHILVSQLKAEYENFETGL